MPILCLPFVTFTFSAVKSANLSLSTTKVLVSFPSMVIKFSLLPVEFAALTIKS